MPPLHRSDVARDWRRGPVVASATAIRGGSVSHRNSATVLADGNTNGRAAWKILGIVTETHDAILALLEDGVPVLVLEEERFNREKQTQECPRLSLEAAFAQMRPGIRDIGVFTTPWDMRVLRTWISPAKASGCLTGSTRCGGQDEPPLSRQHCEGAQPVRSHTPRFHLAERVHRCQRGARAGAKRGLALRLSCQSQLALSREKPMSSSILRRCIGMLILPAADMSGLLRRRRSRLRRK